jgi:hypothetical protein
LFEKSGTERATLSKEIVALFTVVIHSAGHFRLGDFSYKDGAILCHAQPYAKEHSERNEDAGELLCG